MKRKEETINKQSLGITLIALVVTIVILLILAGISVTVLWGDNGIITIAQEAGFKTEVMQYKEKLEMEKVSQSIYQSEISIFDLKQQLEKQMESLEVERTNCEKGVELIETAEEALNEIQETLQTIASALVSGMSDSIKTEIEAKISEINQIANTTKYDNQFLLNGNINANNPYIISLGNGDFDQGNVKITIENVSWKALYGEDLPDYTNLEETIQKIEKAINKVAWERTKIGAKENILDHHMIFHMSKLQEHIQCTYVEIFGDGSNIIEEQAFQKAKSWNTTIGIIHLLDDVYANIYEIEQRIVELAVMGGNDGSDDDTREHMRIELNILLEEIQRELTYTGIGNKKLFDGTFPYVEATTLNSLGVTDISVITPQEASKSLLKIQNAIQRIENRREQLNNKLDELEGKASQEAGKGYAFDVVKGTTSSVTIEEKYKEKLQIINNELIYIGTDSKEKKWAIELGIKIVD